MLKELRDYASDMVQGKEITPLDIIIDAYGEEAFELLHLISDSIILGVPTDEVLYLLESTSDIEELFDELYALNNKEVELISEVTALRRKTRWNNSTEYVIYLELRNYFSDPVVQLTAKYIYEYQYKMKENPILRFKDDLSSDLYSEMLRKLAH